MSTTASHVPGPSAARPGEKSRTIYVPLTNDAVTEPLRSFKVMLGRGDAARSGSVAGEMRVDIVDDD